MLACPYHNGSNTSLFAARIARASKRVSIRHGTLSLEGLEKPEILARQPDARRQPPLTSLARVFLLDRERALKQRDRCGLRGDQRVWRSQRQRRRVQAAGKLNEIE